VWGLVVHTTGAGLPARAYRNGVHVTAEATRWYQRSHGTHYVVGPNGIQGDLIQVANEKERAGGVGTKETRAAIKAGDWTKGLPPVFVSRWRQWWTDAETDFQTPMDLFPGSNANNVYVHCEMPPVVFYDGSVKRVTHEPFTGQETNWSYGRDLSKLRFTEAQHDAVVYLALDLARRYDWPTGWWELGRIVGHEDLSPHTRTHKWGGWDPGWQRNQPYFDFGYVISEIARLSA